MTKVLGILATSYMTKRILMNVLDVQRNTAFIVFIGGIIATILNMSVMTYTLIITFSLLFSYIVLYPAKQRKER